MSINNNGHEKGKLKLTKRQITSGILGHLSNFNYHLQIITFGRSSKILPYITKLYYNLHDHENLH